MTNKRTPKRLDDPRPASGFELRISEQKRIYLVDEAEKKGAAEIAQIGAILGESREQIGENIENWLKEHRRLFKWLGKD